MTEDQIELPISANEDILPYLDSSDIITYSNAVDIILSSACRNQCTYCSFGGRQKDLVVPYSTIKVFKAARKAGAREANIVSGERPDRFHGIRAKFDVWGFNSYIEYIYTISELAFLEGLLVNLNVGFLSLSEMKYLSDIVATVECNLESLRTDLMGENQVHEFAPSKDPQIRIKFLENAGKLNLPVITGLLVGIGESPEDRIATLMKIKEIHEEYGNVQLVRIVPCLPVDVNTVLVPGSDLYQHTLETIRIARELLPNEVDITTTVNAFPDVMTLIEHGVTDLGEIRVYGRDCIHTALPFRPLDEYQQVIENNQYRFLKRLPIKNGYILVQKYSKKLGQFLDKYKIRLKESTKDDKFTLVAL